MSTKKIPEAWVRIPKEEELPQGKRGGYDFGFRAAMGRLLAAHDEIGPAFGALFGKIMFAPGHLNRREREMVAAVAAAGQDCYY